MIRLELLTTSNLDELDFSKCKEYEYFTLEERDKVKNIVHKSWLIAKEHIVNYSKSDLSINLTNGLIAKLSKYKKAEFEDAILS